MENNGIGVYLHWNGGRDSVEGFLEYCKMCGYREPDEDNYGWASLVTVISNFFGCDGLGVGVDVVENLDCDSDNGVYLIKGWDIEGRMNFEDDEEQDNHALFTVLMEFDKRQPKPLGFEHIKEYCEKNKIPMVG